MNDQTIRELDETVRLNPEDAKAYLNREYAYAEKGDYDRAVADFDNAVRLCPNYETDFIDSGFAHGQHLVEKAIAVLESKISDINNPQSAADYYYTGIVSLFLNDRLAVQRCFEAILELGYEERDKVEKHLANLKYRK